MSEDNQPFRLAFRGEGMFWNAYVAKPNSMEGAILIGSIAGRVIEVNEAIRKEFIALMQAAVAETLQQIGESGVQWGQPEVITEAEHPAHG